MQLSQTIRVLTPLGEVNAYFMFSDDSETYWQVFINRTGESWYFRNQYIRLGDDISAGIGPASPIFRYSTWIRKTY